MVEVKEVPKSVKVISIMFFIGAAILIILGILAIYLELKAMGVNPSDQLRIASIPEGIFAILLGVVNIMVGIYLWKLKRWARFAGIILTGLGMLVLFVTLISRVYFAGFQTLPFYSVPLLIIATIFFYLLFNKKIKEAFTSNLPQTS